MYNSYTTWDDDALIGENHIPTGSIGKVREQMDPVDIHVVPPRKVRRPRAIPQSDSAHKSKRYGMTPGELAKWKQRRAGRE